MTEAILMGIAIAVMVVGIAFVAFAYGLKCGKQMKDIPRLVDKKPDEVDVEIITNAGPYG